VVQWARRPASSSRCRLRVHTSILPSWPTISCLSAPRMTLSCASTHRRSGSRADQLESSLPAGDIVEWTGFFANRLCLRVLRSGDGSDSTTRKRQSSERSSIPCSLDPQRRLAWRARFSTRSLSARLRALLVIRSRRLGFAIGRPLSQDTERGCRRSTTKTARCCAMSLRSSRRTGPRAPRDSLGRCRT